MRPAINFLTLFIYEIHTNNPRVLNLSLRANALKVTFETGKILYFNGNENAIMPYLRE